MAVVKFRTFLKIDKKKINEDLAKIPDQSYVLGLKVETLKAKILVLELQQDETEALLAAQIRNKYKRIKEALTETAIKDLKNSNPELRELKKKINDLKKTYRLGKLKQKALTDKFECMVQISHNVRADKKILSDNTKGL